MWRKNLAPGWRVRNSQDGRFGVIVPDALSICGKNDVLVEYDRSRGEQATKKKFLKPLTVVRPEIDRHSCKGCVFFTGLACMRYSRGRLSMMSNTNGTRIPDRIYPYCKEENHQGERHSAK